LRKNKHVQPFRVLEIFPTINILGSRIHKISIRDVIQLIERWIDTAARHPKPHQIIVSGFHGIWEAYRNPDLKTVFNSADAWIPDGIAPVFLARLKGFRHMDRAPGAELMKAFFQIADKKGCRSFFYGDTDKTLTRLKKSCLTIIRVIKLRVHTHHLFAC